MIEEITIQDNGKQVILPLVFGVKTYQTFAQKHAQKLGETLQVVGGALQIKSPSALADVMEIIIELTAIALSEGARKAGKPDRYTIDDVTDLIDNNPDLFEVLSEMVGKGLATNVADFTIGRPRQQNEKTAEPPLSQVTTTGTRLPSDK